MILIDDTEASLEFSNSTEHYFRLIFARSVFSPDLLNKFVSQKMIGLDVMRFTSQSQNIRLLNLAKKDV